MEKFEALKKARALDGHYPSDYWGNDNPRCPHCGSARHRPGQQVPRRGVPLLRVDPPLSHGVRALLLRPVRLGEPLALGPTGRVPKGCYFVTSEHKDGFDSRYAAIGWICGPRILGVGRPIL